MFRHSKIKQLISAYFDSQVSSKEKETVENHLKKCSACKKYLQDLMETNLALKKWQDEEITPDLEQKIKTKFLGDKYKKGVFPVKRKTVIRATESVAVLVTLIICVLAVQVYTKRGIQSRLRETSDEIGRPLKPTAVQIIEMAKTTTSTAATQRTKSPMYEPYYLSSKIEMMNGIVSSGGVRDSSWALGWMGESQIAATSCATYPRQEFNTEQYERIYENDFLLAKENPLSTFSIDVDTASYSNVRRFLNSNQLPPQDAVRIEEMINYFTYDYPQPKGTDPFSITTELAGCPWNSDHELLLVGLQGKNIETQNMPPSNLVFLIDVSGSMQPANKLPLLKSAFKLLVKQLRPEDNVAIVVYAGAAGLVLDSTSGKEKEKILEAIDRLEAGGSTAGGAGIKLAYEIAKKNFIKNGNNRVILATDGDFNTGVSSDAEMVRLIEEKRNDGIFLTVLGFGMGNYKDAKMEKIADKGNGNLAYIDNLLEAKKVFVNELGATLLTIAKDVKIQIEFNPAKIKAYRLVGYENRMLKKEDFNDDKKDAGEMGAGHSVTALYEIVPSDSKEEFSKVDDLQYQKTTVVPSEDVVTVKLRYKEPDGDTSKLIEVRVAETQRLNQPSDNLNFAAAVAEFGLILRHSEYKSNASYEDILKRARASRGTDEYGYRAEFIQLVEIAQMLDNR